MDQAMDRSKAEAFARRMMALLNDASLGMLVSIGHQTRLFDTMAEMPAATRERIAELTGLHERYVREWLGGMVVARIVLYDPATKTYVFPCEHAAFLTRAAGPNNLVYAGGRVEQPRLLHAIHPAYVRCRSRCRSCFPRRRRRPL